MLRKIWVISPFASKYPICIFERVWSKNKKWEDKNFLDKRWEARSFFLLEGRDTVNEKISSKISGQVYNPVIFAILLIFRSIVPRLNTPVS